MGYLTSSIEDFMHRHNFDQQDLAEIINRPHKTVNAICLGKKLVTPETAIELGLALDIDPFYFLACQSVDQLASLGHVSKYSLDTILQNFLKEQSENNPRISD